MKIALLGYGKMGKTIEKIALKKGHTIVLKTNQDNPKIDLSLADIAIEFSSPETAVKNISTCFKQNTPVVSGTTGWLKNYKEIIKLCNNCNGSFIYASNFSIGVNLFFNINKYVAQLMKPYNQYLVSVDETHHTQKKDSPSGTAISLAEELIQQTHKKGWLLDQKKEDFITINAKREDDIKGTHQINYKSNIDTISLKHEAHSREGFALGAIFAAEWLLHKKGVFTMKDVLNL